jgi:RNA polymerase sigma-B factor
VTTDNTPRPPAGAHAPRRSDEYGHLEPLFRERADPATSPGRRDLLADQLVLGHLRLAEHIAMRFRNRGQAIDDLRQVATIGLINAVRRYDPDRGDFLSFAVPTITGEIRRYFRDATWAVRVPRRLQELSASLDAAGERLANRLGRAPRPSELATELELDLDDVHEGLQAKDAYTSRSLDRAPAATDAEPALVERLGHTESGYPAAEARTDLRPALAALPEREATIVLLRFFDNLTQQQIADRMGISQMHVSRLLSASLRRMRLTLDSGPAPAPGCGPDVPAPRGETAQRAGRPQPA